FFHFRVASTARPASFFRRPERRTRRACPRDRPPPAPPQPEERMSSLGTKPQKPKAHWPPHNYLVQRAVTGADNVKSLAIFYGGTGPGAISYFNFDPYDPDEVNGYLYHYVGCRVSKDGKNYSFIGDGTGPLYVYIPHGGWVPPPKKSAADLAKDSK